jgi:hypothetical protein
VLTTFVGALMYASQVGPHQAVSNLSQWAVKLGIENPPEWLKAKSADRVVRRQATTILAVFLLIGGFLGGMAFEDHLWSTTPSKDGPMLPASHWEPLTANEAVALRVELRSFAPEHLNVLCAIPSCADLAESIYALLHDLNWSGTYESSYFTDGGIKSGIEIWSFARKADTRNKIVDAIERTIKGRLKISSHQWDQPHSPENANDINLIIGRMR